MNKDVVYGKGYIDPERQFINESAQSFHPGVYTPNKKVVSGLINHPKFSDQIDLGVKLLTSPPSDPSELEKMVKDFDELGDIISADVEETTRLRVKREDWSAAIYLNSRIHKG